MKTARIHSLDSLRAIMMMLGLVLHSALTYNVTDHGDVWSLKDPESTHIATDFLILMIHSFRMPIFFLIAGFFGAMLFYERSPKRMIHNRIARIIFPFIVFLILLAPMLDFSFGFSSQTLNGEENALQNALQPFSNFYFYIPKSTSHLWFLYYLIFCTAFAVVLALCLKKTPKITSQIKTIGNWIFPKPLIRMLFFAGMTFVMLTILQTPMVASSTSLTPDAHTFIYYVFFYLIGWILYKCKQHLHTIRKFDWFATISAIILVVTQGFIIQYADMDLKPNTNSPLLIAFSAFTVWLFIFGITGLFIRYGSKHSKRMRYISDASYWVYLIHLPLTALFPLTVWKLPIGAIPKFLLVTTATTIVCFVTYHYCVRNTFIGKFLNGRKYPRNK
ncbi:glucans biosynthesis protein C [Kordia sp. SMS9]|uniref:acyltransferase family protein n=1 Tax=Kordia sp. SMS9 TaxID=2282170 RepID=UPI000E10CAEB|nr:acyltransferase family protein [Kordia sp. SMS9]AXG70321.1 glucans biosynthesis protein C [Kordia sp. SMS9]